MAVTPTPLVTANDKPAETIAGRYDVQAVLGQGGMGTVYRVRDRADGRCYALKCLRLARGSRHSLLQLFEREYATLAELSHPRIIEVYDYGNDGEIAYYTMELLEGADLAALAPRPYLEACRVLRDVASSLSLLHARKLVHRDISPRNVHRTPDGQSKLLDFGALTGFGEAAPLIGTPPCLAPEALEGAGLDQRADLYGLGCLAYHLLTGRHAYPASHIGQLPSYWAQPVPPPSAAKPERAADGQLLPEIPPALDELVTWLMRPERSARPSTAAVVIDRLNVLLGDEPPEELGLAESQLRSAPLVGRSAELETVERHFTQLLHGRGQSLLVHGSAGAGKSRLLSAIALRARLLSLAVVHVDAALHERGYQAARAICLGLVHAFPGVGAELSPRTAAALRALLPELAGDPAGSIEIGEADPTEGDGALWHGRVQAALRDLVLACAARKPLVLVVDNLDGCDRASAVFIATLAEDTRRHPLYLVSACDSAAADASGSVCDALRQHSSSAALAGMEEPALRSMLEGLFGDVSNLPRLSQALHAAAAGHPGESVELLRALLHAGELRYQQGSFSLPLEPAATLAADLGGQSVRDRVASLSAGARELLRVLGLYGGALTRDVCAALAADPSCVDEQLAELVARQLLAHNQQVYVFTHARVRAALTGALSAEDRRRLHQRIAELILRREQLRLSERLEAGSYLLEAGDPRGLPLVHAGAIEICVHSRVDAACVPYLERALELCRSQRRSQSELAPILSALCACSYMLDRRLDRHAPEFFASYRKLLGLDIAARWQPLAGTRLSALLGLGVAWLRYQFTARAQRPADFVTLCNLYVAGALCLAGKAALCLDRPAIEQAIEGLAPLRVLGESSEISFAYDFTRGLSLLTQERLAETHVFWRGLEARLLRPGSFPRLSPHGRRLWEGGVQYILGMLESFADDARALERAALLEASEHDVNLLAAAQLRRMYHGFRGEAGEVARAEAQVEACALRLGSAWQAETFSAIVTNYCASLSHDLITTKLALDETERLAVELPTLERYVHTSRAVYTLVRGKPLECISIYDRVFADESPRERIGSSASVGLQAEAYLQVGEPARARQIVEARLDSLSDDDARYVHLLLPLHVSLLGALGALGEHAEAKQLADTLIARHPSGASPLALGSLHEAAARLAFLRKDAKSFTHHLKHVEQLFCPLGHSALIARYTNLTQLGGAEGGVTAKIATMRELKAFDSTLAALTDRELLAQHVFAWLMQKCDGFRGFLIAHQGGVLVPLLSSDGSEPATEVLAMVQRGLGSLLQEDVTTHLPDQLETHVERPALRREQRQGDNEAVHVHLLSYVQGGKFFGEGALVLRGPAGKPPRIRYDYLQVAAKHLNRLRPKGSLRPAAPESGAPASASRNPSAWLH